MMPALISLVRKSPYLRQNLVQSFGYDPSTQIMPNTILINENASLERFSNTVQNLCCICGSPHSIRHCSCCFKQTCTGCLVECQQCGEYVCHRRSPSEDERQQPQITCVKCK